MYSRPPPKDSDLPPLEGLGLDSDFDKNNFCKMLTKWNFLQKFYYVNFCNLPQTQIPQIKIWKRVIGKPCGLHISITITPYRSVSSQNEGIYSKSRSKRCMRWTFSEGKFYFHSRLNALMIVSIQCNVQVFVEFRKGNMETKLFLGYQCIRLLRSICMTLWR